ncbi:MAG TPA: cell division ATP-binding protein FtsE [Firmicutes bacterium]|uniref:Cell division ATP-binding protein FtsE n=1 Tax=Capillibacterium thermochitinicola TaxID=2699427 RepID=A0A8J6LIM4_9FIRM|nr:cell division ATP-binding protein FtsE [Capillibacterium thermochitinicola]MBA2133190.1 cell division ATP-binding protein FtsE [Capillibacterium thermochitinicola]HHW12082.1 cell division ATP-binding protein FtsE [Bacillota bacterium]
MLIAKKLTKIYNNGVVALDQVSLIVQKGEFVFLVGPSGAGKTTFLNLVIRQEVPTSGLISVNQQNLAYLKKKEIAFLRRNIGVIFQDYKLLPQKTVYENVAFALEVIEAKPRMIKPRVYEVLELVGLLNKANLFPSELSGGEQQRVCLARALVNRPLLLLADEPTGNLDPDTSWGIMELLREVNRRGTTIVMATHNREIVDQMRRRVIALDRGKLVRDTPKGGYTLET